MVRSASSAHVTVVLVHGAWADGSCWSKVISLLQEKRIPVVGVQNPVTSLADDSAATRRALALVKGPVVLVGHSWGGAVITESGDKENVKALVYVAAFAPTKGKSLNELLKDAPVPSWQNKLIVDKEGFITMPFDVVANDFAQDIPQNEKELLTAVQGAVAARIFDDKIMTVAWEKKPSWYVVATEDHMIHPSLQRSWAKRMKSKTTELKTSHAPMLSKPREVAAVIMDAVTAVTEFTHLKATG